MEHFHYPPDIMFLLIETIPRLSKSKKDVLLFFKGAGVPDSIIQPFEIIIDHNKESINKYQMVREILEKISEQNDRYLQQRREILKRVCQFDTFDVCFEDDRDKAKANVAEISKLVRMKDTVTKLENHLESKRQEELDKKKREVKKNQELNKKYDEIKSNFNALFAMVDPVKRGKALEPVLNDLFLFNRISLSEAFTVTVDNKVVEQIDGAITLDGRTYIIEMKWEKEPIGVDKVGRFISRLFLRNDVGGVIISASPFTEPAIITANEAVSQQNIILVDLKDIYNIVDSKKDLKQFLRIMLSKSKINKKPNFKIDIYSLDDLNFIELCK